MATDEYAIYDPERRSISYNGAEVHLSPLEAKLIEAVARRNGRVAYRDVLLDEVYQDEEPPPSNTFGAMVFHIRQKMRAAKFPPSIGLQSRWKTNGYWAEGILIHEAISIQLNKRQRGDLQELINTHPNEALADRVFLAVND